MAITLAQYKTAATLIGCELPVIQTVAGVESNGSGFLSDGRIKILFEPHIFWQQLKIHKVNFNNILKANADILYQHQGEKPYGTFNEQYTKLARAKKIHAEAALESCSWGKYQPLGKYHKECGFDTVTDMVKRYGINEYEHLIGFTRMIKFRKLDKVLQVKDWETFKLRYNGRGKNDYVARLKAMYAKLSK